MPRFLRLLILLIILLALGYAAWWKLQHNKQERAAEIALTLEENPEIPVTVVRAGPLQQRDTFRVDGSFEPSQVVAVVPTVNGQILRLPARNGAYVRAGEVLLEVDNEYTQNELRAAEITLANAHRNLERMSTLIGEGGVTQQQYDEVKAKVESGEIQIESLRKRLKDAFIRAPINGTIAPIPQRPMPVKGGFVGQGNPLFQIVNTDRVLLNVPVTAAQVIRLREGQPVQITTSVYPGKTFAGTVSAIGVTTDFLSKRYPVEITIANDGDRSLRGGMSGQAIFDLGPAPAGLAVPRQAFIGPVEDGELFIIEKNQAYRRRVSTGALFGDQVLIRDGLREGEVVVISGQNNLSDSVQVRIVQ